MRATSKSIATGGIVVFLLGAPLVHWIWLRELLYVVAAYHLISVPPSQEYWFSFFFWAAWCIPAIWVACLVLALVETIRRKRLFLLATYLAAPYGVALTHRVVWGVFVSFLPY